MVNKFLSVLRITPQEKNFKMKWKYQTKYIKINFMFILDKLSSKKVKHITRQMSIIVSTFIG